MQVDLGKQTDANNLPQQTQHKVLCACNHVLRANVDDVAADGSRRVEGQRLVLGNQEGVEFLQVDGAGVDRVGHGRVDQLAQHNAVLDRREQRLGGVKR